MQLNEITIRQYHKQEHVPNPLHWVRLQLNDNVKDPVECIMYTPEYKYGAHALATRTPLLTNQGLHISMSHVTSGISACLNAVTIHVRLQPLYKLCLASELLLHGIEEIQKEAARGCGGCGFRI